MKFHDLLFVVYPLQAISARNRLKKFYQLRLMALFELFTQMVIYHAVVKLKFLHKVEKI